MFLKIPDFDIAKIADSGQCFRLRENADGSYGLVHKGRYLRLSNDNSAKDDMQLSGYRLDCSDEDFESVWHDYFDLSYDYGAVRAAVEENDEFLINAILFGNGIRILRQDPWEMLISFIISQRKSIPAIQTSIEKLCKLCGDRIDTPDGDKYSFPSPKRVASLSINELNSCSLGYRSKYIEKAAQLAASGAVNLYGMSKLSDVELKEKLLDFYGVGTKVADCVMLFGYHRLDAFPADVWIKRALANEYPNGFPYEKYKGYGGVMQQYMFYYMRSGQKKIM